MTKSLEQMEKKILTVLDLKNDPSKETAKHANPLFLLDLKNLKDIIFVQDVNLDIVFVSSAAEALLGYTNEEIKKLGVAKLMTPGSLGRAIENYNKYYCNALKKAKFDIPLMEYEYVRKDGSTLWGELKVNFVRDADGNILGSQGILRDISDRKKMEYYLSQSNNKFYTLFNLSPQAIALTEINTGKIIDVNQKFCQLTKYNKDELIGKTTTQLGLYSKEHRNSFIKNFFESGEVKNFEMDFITKDGSILNSMMYSKTIELETQSILLTVFYDQTRVKQLEQLFWQAQKMKTVGTLAGSIAHDLNNFLMVIKGFTDLLLTDTKFVDSQRKMLNSINEHVHSCAQLIKQLLGYARKDNNWAALFDLNQFIKDAIHSIKKKLKTNIVHFDLDSELMLVKGDAMQIMQLLYNLFINAIDAMPDGGELFIKTSNFSYEEMTGRAYKPKKRKYVYIGVTDTGVGMNPEILDNLFEPFFTTKEEGKGTGLGLASVYGIVKAHQGYIDVESQIGQGSTFSIYLPVSTVV